MKGENALTDEKVLEWMPFTRDNGELGLWGQKGVFIFLLLFPFPFQCWFSFKEIALNHISGILCSSPTFRHLKSLVKSRKALERDLHFWNVRENSLPHPPPVPREGRERGSEGASQFPVMPPKHGEPFPPVKNHSVSRTLFTSFPPLGCRKRIRC